MSHTDVLSIWVLGKSLKINLKAKWWWNSNHNWFSYPTSKFCFPLIIAQYLGKSVLCHLGYFYTLLDTFIYTTTQRMHWQMCFWILVWCDRGSWWQIYLFLSFECHLWPWPFIHKVARGGVKPWMFGYNYCWGHIIPPLSFMCSNDLFVPFSCSSLIRL